jgi:hypothetical protein
MMHPVRTEWPAAAPMLERALPLPHPEIAHGQDRAARRSMYAGAILHDVARHLTRVLGAFFAAGGALS